MSGERSPRNGNWQKLLEVFDIEQLAANLEEMLRAETLAPLLESFGLIIDADQAPDLKNACYALAVQFLKIVEGTGSAENIIIREYQRSPVDLGNDLYFRRSVAKYSYIILPGGGTCDIRNHFVCNSIAIRSANFPFLHDSAETILEDIRLQDLSSNPSLKQYKRFLMIAGGGFGKTTTMQHLFLDAATERKKTGLFPVYVEVRHYTKCKSLIDCILRSITHFDPSFTLEQLIRYLELGKMQILLDGLDEMDPLAVEDFQVELNDLADLYPNNQIIIATRDCDAMKSLNTFYRLYLLPFDFRQTNELLDNYLNGPGHDLIKNRILNFMDSGFIRKDGYFVTNPMLLTYAILNQETLTETVAGRIEFYSNAFKMLIKEHDQEKIAYRRHYFSVQDSGEFADVFSEFCAITYLEGVSSFTEETFKHFFNRLKSRKNVANPKSLHWDSFLQDVCATACIMYEKHQKIYYIDTGFQEYLFANYYATVAETKETRDMGKVLWANHASSYTLDAFEMLFHIAPHKFNFCLTLPLLEYIFSGNDDEAFLRFLAMGYDDISYKVFHSEIVKQYSDIITPSSRLDMYFTHESKNIILLFILYNCYDLSTKGFNSYDFRLCYEGAVKDQILATDSGAILSPYYVSLSSIDRDDNTLIYPQEVMDMPDIIRDDNGHPLEFGVSCTLETGEIIEDPEAYDLLINELKKESCQFQTTFLFFKQYYLDIRSEKKLLGYK